MRINGVPVLRKLVVVTPLRLCGERLISGFENHFGIMLLINRERGLHAASMQQQYRVRAKLLGKNLLEAV